MVSASVIVPPSGVPFPTVDIFHTKAVDGMERHHPTNFTRAEHEDGAINGTAFRRTRWSGESSGRKLKGIVYSAIVGQTLVILSTQDVELHVEPSLRIGEATIMTFKAKN
jgi:hypothetical protein